MSSPDEAGDRAMEWMAGGIVYRLIEALRSPNLTVGFPAVVLSPDFALEAAEAIAALSSDANDKRIAELEAERERFVAAIKRLIRERNSADEAAAEYQSRAEAAEAQLRLTGTEDAGVRALVEAAEPFAEHYAAWMEKYPDETATSTFPSHHTIGQLRALRNALTALTRRT